HCSLHDFMFHPATCESVTMTSTDTQPAGLSRKKHLMPKEFHGLILSADFADYRRWGRRVWPAFALVCAHLRITSQ
ncbi:MAG: hypothetical protein WCR20_05300, partial [Verrucomicrobiota bacterium]